MCGIFGFTGRDTALTKQIAECMCHRGPDARGSTSGIEQIGSKVTLGHLRLAIIDLSKGGYQPMFYSKKLGACSERHNKQNISKSQCSLVFNGEIYNFQDIKSQLEKKNYTFTTKSDSEVILAAYLEWGTSCVNKFNGMWALAIYDFRNETIFCSRDRMGKKPLYYHHSGKKFIFSSELKGILAHKNLKTTLNKEAIDIYLTIGYIPSPMSIFNEVSKLEARQNLIFNIKTGNVATHYYYDIPKYNPIYERKVLVEEGRKLLKDATRLRLISDVPVGAFLSGGLDSSAVVATMAEFKDLSKLHTFSIGFEGKYDESQYINEVKDTLGTNHHHKYFTRKDFESILDKISYYYDEPFGDYSNFPTYEVSRLARKYVTVCLSGDGGDEIFGGYFFHKTVAKLEVLGYSPKILRKIAHALITEKDILTKSGSVKEALRMSLAKPEDFYASVGSEFVYKPENFKKWTRQKMREVLKTSKDDLREAIIKYDLFYNTLCDNFLVKVDRASMANSLEVRSPFLDYRFVEFESKIPVEWKTDGFKTKILMRDIIKGIVPEKILNRGKQGFTPPIQEWVYDKKHFNSIKTGLDKLHGMKIIDDNWYEFYSQKAFVKRNDIYANYNIRLLLFIKWCEKWQGI